MRNKDWDKKWFGELNDERNRRVGGLQGNDRNHVISLAYDRMVDLRGQVNVCSVDILAVPESECVDYGKHFVETHYFKN